MNIHNTPKDIGIGDKERVFFVAEAGINHNGSVERALELIKVAKECGADAVKFQKRTVSRILTKEGLNKPYDTPNSFGNTYGEHKKFLELSFDDFRKMKAYADEIGIIFMASGWDEESVDFLDEIGVPIFKMASADLTNLPLLIHTALKNKPMILSTGMADFETVKEAYEVVSMRNDKVAILQCTSSYPTLNSDINLNVIKTYQNEFKQAVIGYSGHEKGIAISIGAVTLGAKIVERHFTLDRTMYGSDQAASLTPEGFSRLVGGIKVISEAMSLKEDKKILDIEKPIAVKLRAHIKNSI